MFGLGLAVGPLVVAKNGFAVRVLAKVIPAKPNNVDLENCSTSRTSNTLRFCGEDTQQHDMWQLRRKHEEVFAS